MPVIGRIIYHRVLTTRTPIGRKVRPRMISTGEPLIRVKPKDLAAAGVERVPRVTGVEDGLPQLEDGRSVDAANVVWCTGFYPGFSFVHLPVLGPKEPMHERGMVGSEPGLFFIGLKFLHSVSSEQIHGVGRDADHIAQRIAARREVRPRIDPSTIHSRNGPHNRSSLLFTALPPPRTPSGSPRSPARSRATSSSWGVGVMFHFPEPERPDERPHVGGGSCCQRADPEKEV